MDITTVVTKTSEYVAHKAGCQAATRGADSVRHTTVEDIVDSVKKYADEEGPRPHACCKKEITAAFKEAGLPVWWR